MIPKVGDIVQGRHHPQTKCKVLEITDYVIVMELLEGIHTEMIGCHLADDKTLWARYWRRAV